MVLVILSMIVIPPSYNASALSCAPATLQQQIDRATVIFAGKVTSMQTATSDKAANASFEVTEYWKGQVGKKITIGGIYAWTGNANPPPYFVVGNTYLVFAHSVPNSAETKNIPDNLFASINCGRTTLLASANEEKVALGEGKIPVGNVPVQQIPPAIPPAPRPISGETNYQKCLNRAILTRETSAKTAYQEFNLTVESERAELAKAARPFSGWLAWLNIFRREDVKNFERLNNEYVKALEKATPAKEMAIKKSDNKFTIDKEFCFTHQDITYKWTPEDQSALDQLVPPRLHGDSKGDIQK